MQFPYFHTDYKGYQIVVVNVGTRYQVRGFDNIFLSMCSAEMFIDILLSTKITPHNKKL